MSIEIKTPRGRIYLDGDRAALELDPGLSGKLSAGLSRAQKFVDSEVLRLSAPYVPLRTGMLVQSGILGTVIGSGAVRYVAPYARRQYYSPRPVGSATGPLRGPMWFQRMKTARGREILDGARKITEDGK